METSLNYALTNLKSNESQLNKLIICVTIFRRCLQQRKKASTMPSTHLVSSSKQQIKIFHSLMDELKLSTHFFIRIFTLVKCPVERLMLLWIHFFLSYFSLLRILRFISMLNISMESSYINHKPQTSNLLIFQ